MPVQLSQRPVAADTGSVDPHDGFSAPDQSKLHETAPAFFRGFPDRSGRIIEFKGIAAFRKRKSCETVLVIRAFIENAVHRMVSVNVFMGEAEADIVLERGAAAPGNGSV